MYRVISFYELTSKLCPPEHFSFIFGPYDYFIKAGTLHFAYYYFSIGTFHYVSANKKNDPMYG